jgi:hypothetical protein
MSRRLAPDQIERDVDLAPRRDLGGSRALFRVERVDDTGIVASSIHGQGSSAAGREAGSGASLHRGTASGPNSTPRIGR